MGTRVFIPFGEFLPDRKLFGNEGLLRAYGVCPISGNYISTPRLERLNTGSGFQYYGLHLHQFFNAGVRETRAYAGEETKLVQLSYEGVPAKVDKSGPSAPYSFLASPPLDSELWDFASYGDNIVATNLNDPVQYLDHPTTAAFADLITSTFKPQFRFAVPIRQNLFGFYCFLPATFDGIAAGTHPQLGVWSQNDNIRVFGSENVDPTHIGAGYQQFIGGDLGPITAAIGGEYGIVFCARGIVRIDGPPYEFRVIAEGDTTLFPYSVFRLGDDVYFWGAAGPSVLMGGEAPVRRLAAGKAQRALLDTVTGFGADFARKASLGAREISGGADPINELLRWAYRPEATATLTANSGGNDAYLLFDYALRDERLTVSKCPTVDDPSTGEEEEVSVQFLRQEPAKEGVLWGPFGSLFGITSMPLGAGLVSSALVRFNLSNTTEGSIPAMELRTGFGRLSETNTTRIVAVRPVWSNKEGQAATIEGATEIQVHTKNKSWEDETDSSLHATFNDDGWIGTDTTVVGTYHSITLKFKNTTTAINEIHEIEGLEIDYVDGPAYGA